ncbi:ATP-binding protein [Polyangium aurulentum]|uniref:ATP-binding protein n=1 Tax=Polyangium aurulentum TaxID=2567896 RepID=UPI0010AE3AF1|nr:ATP-binding protein [Polyangium aurulentum]UQA62840.1 ATP-binding protein [Polyangium aurulentum]
MDSKTHEALSDFREELQLEVEGARAVLASLDRADLTLTRAEPADPRGAARKSPRSWLLYWEPGKHVRERFDLAPELLVVLVPAREVQARDVDKAEQAIRRDYRLDRGVVLVVARDREAAERMSHAARATGRVYIFLSFAEVANVSDPQQWLRQILLEHLGSSDLFATGAPVFGWDFVGRKRELLAIRRHLLGGRPVGLYGLRKVGKTSVLLVLRDQLVAESSAEERVVTAVPVHLDLLGVSFAEANRAGFMRYLLRSIHEAIERLGLSPRDLGLPGSDRRRRRGAEESPAEIETLGVATLDALIDWARRQASRPIVLLFIDEYERLLGGSGFPEAHGVEILDWIRGLVQRYPGTFNFLVAGLNRHLASVPVVVGRQNPLFNFVIDFPLAGLVEEEHGELVRKIGRRLSLRFEHDALALIYEESGGHAWLARELGRVIDQETPVAGRAPIRIDRAAVERLIPEFRRGVGMTMEEIQRAVSDLDPGAPAALARAEGNPAEAQAAYHELSPRVLDDLERYGVLAKSPEGAWRVRIGCFGAFLQENWGSGRGRRG